jgi:Flp pilus assembly protein TadD
MAYYRLGYINAVDREWAVAAALFRKALRLDPNNARALNNLSVVYLNLGQLDRAEEALLRLRRVSAGGNYRLWYNLATVRALRGDLRSACKYIDRALWMNPLYDKARAFRRSRCHQP